MTRFRWTILLCCLLLPWGACPLLADERPAQPNAAKDWPWYGGTPGRNGTVQGDLPLLEAQWRKPTFEQSTTKGWIDQATAFVNQRKLPLLPASFPITATATRDGKKVPLLIYRSHWGIYAADLKTGDLKWKAGSAWSLDTMMSKPQKQPALASWANYYVQTLQKPTLLFQNTTIGTLSTDNVHVYAIEDLAVPPPPTADVDPRFGQRGNLQRYDTQVSDAIEHNRLQAYDLAAGKLKWELGGRGNRAGELADAFFLGAPLPIDGKLYTLVEKEGKLLLVCLDPLRRGQVQSAVELFFPAQPLLQDSMRRMQAAHLAFAAGRLVCPTNAGAIVSVDTTTREVVWTCNYRETEKGPPRPQLPGFNPRLGRRFPPPGWIMSHEGQWMPPPGWYPHWLVTAPIIQDRKVVFTAPDSRFLHCLDLNTGKPVWSQEHKEDDLFLGGVFNSKVLIVGKRNVRALQLATGELVWNLEVGLPSGQGMASDKLYYLPLKAAARTGEPEVCALDIDKGIVHGRARSRGKEVPGNLLFTHGLVISQGLAEIVAFPQLLARLNQIDERLKQNPNDAVGLTEQGEIRLNRGDLPGAVEALLQGLKNKPDQKTETRAKARLYEALTEYFQRDFKAAEKYLKEYEALCQVDLNGAFTEQEKQDRQKEARQRRANFLFLVGQGKQSQRNLLEAFEKYREFATLAAKDALISVLDEPSVRAAPDVWSQGRIRAMIDFATPEERKPLEGHITALWKEVQKSKARDDLRSFVQTFGSVGQSSKEARLRLAERLIEDNDPLALLEAERHLYLLRGPREERRVAARAIECLARLQLAKGRLRDAAYYYRMLQRDFGKVTVRDGKTGADIFDMLASDKRMLPYLDEPEQLGSGGKVKVTEERGNFQYQNQTYQLGQVGEKLPFFQENQFVIRFQPHSLRMLDPGTGQEKWNQMLTPTMFQNLVFSGQPNTPKFSFLNLGHLVVLPLAHMVFGIDPINRKVLWEKNLHASSFSAGQSNAPTVNQQVPLTVDPRDGSVLITYTDGWVQRLGITNPLEGNVLCLQTRDALVGIDPLTGRTLWTRSDVTPRSHLFGDDQLLYVVEVNQDGKATSTKALRAYDGVSVKVPDFTAHFAHRIGQLGRILAVSETALGGTTLRLYDIAIGKDVWKCDFPAGSVLLKSEDPHLAGLVEPDGRVHVVNLQTHKEVLQARVDPKHLARAQQVWLLSDTQDYYLAVNGPWNPQLMPVGGVQSNLMPGTGLRSLPVNGMVYCFNGGNGQLRWNSPVLNQMLVLDHFRELPFLLFSSRFQQVGQAGPGQRAVWQAAVRSIQKSSGKSLYESDKIPGAMTFHALNVDARGGKVELVGYQMKIVHQLNGDAAKP